MNVIKRAFLWLFSQPYLLLFLTTLFWAGNAIAGKLAIGHISPFMLTTLRWLVTVAIILPFALPHLKRDWQTLRPNLIFLFVLGTIGFSAFNNMMYTALTHTSTINVAIVQASLPLFIFALNFLWFRLSTTRNQIIGFPITVIGVMIITSQGSLEAFLNLNFNFGDILMIAAIASYGVYSVFLKNKPDVHWLSLMAVLAYSSFLTSIPVAAFEIATQKVIWPDLIGMIIVVYTAICASLMAQVFWIRGVELIGSNRTAMFINLVPVLGTLMAIIFLGESFEIYHGIGMATIIGGVWIAQQKVRSKVIETPAPQQ